MAMPVPCLFDGCSNCVEGFMDARYCNMSGTVSLLGLCAGYEVALGNALWRWETGVGECLNGFACLTIHWYRPPGACIGGFNGCTCINIGENYIQWYEGMIGIGIAGWEICANGDHCTRTLATTISGDNVYIDLLTIDINFCCVASTAQTARQGNIWVEGNDLHYFNANCWEHTMVGDSQGAAGVDTDGAMWIDNACYLHWVGADCNDYRAKWRICQFCSTFSGGAPANPAPGASYKGSLWVDDQFGATHLSYIGCDGNKYLAGAGECPYIAP